MNRQQQTEYERWCVEQRIVKMEDLIQSSHYKELKIYATKRNTNEHYNDDFRPKRNWEKRINAKYDSCSNAAYTNNTEASSVPF